MGLFVKKKDGNLSLVTGESSSGFNAIENHFAKLYPKEVNPKHFCPVVAWRFGGNDPLDEIDIYNGDEYYHFVTFGLSELYEKENKIKDVSGYGMEFTLKLKKDKTINDDTLKDICEIIQDIARITFTEGELFNKYEYLDFGDNLFNSNICGFITVPDPLAKSINTKNGKVDFILLVGVTKEELKLLREKDITVKGLYSNIGDITNLKRKSTF